MNTWIDNIESGSFHAPLVTLELRGKQGKTYQGQGRLEWNHCGVTLSAVTDGGGDAFKELIQGLPSKPGELIAADDFLSLEATTQDGWCMTCERLSDGHFSEVHGQPVLTWNFGSSDFLSGLKFSRNSDSRSRSFRVEAILHNCHLAPWTRVSVTTYNNDRFGTEKHDRDWLQFDCELGSVAVQRRDDGLARLRIESDDKSSDLQNGLRAVSAAMAFLTGRRVDCIAREVNCDSIQKRFLATRPSRCCEPPYMGPFGNDTRLAVGYEPFLGLATNYFSTPTGQQVAGLLDACINATENSFTTQAMVACATVESLVDTHKYLVRPAEDSSERRALLTSVREKVEELIVHLNVEERDRNRIGGLFGMLHSTSISATLRELCESGWANLTKVEVKAWSELRNQVMHGKLALGGADRTKIQKQITRQQLVVNLINKVVLQAVGYSGPFFDYSTWGISRFEPKVAVVAPIEDRA